MFAINALCVRFALTQLFLHSAPKTCFTDNANAPWKSNNYQQVNDYAVRVIANVFCFYLKSI